MEDVYNGGKDIMTDPTLRMSQRPQALQKGKQFEALGNDFAFNNGRNVTYGQKSRRDAAFRGAEGKARFGGSGGNRFGKPQTTSSLRNAPSLESEFDRSYDELDCLSKRKENPPSYADSLEKKSADLKKLKFKKNSQTQSGSTSQPNSQPELSESITKVPLPSKENRAQRKASPSPTPKQRIDPPLKDETRYTRSQGSPNYKPLRDKEANSTICVPVNGVKDKPLGRPPTDVDDAKSQSPRPKPRRIQKSTQPDQPPPPSIEERPSSPQLSSKSLTRKPSTFPLDNLSPLAESKVGQQLGRKSSAFPALSPPSSTTSRKEAEDFPMLSPLASQPIPASSLASLPPVSSLFSGSSDDERSGKAAKRGKVKGKHKVNGNRKTLMTDEDSSPSSGDGSDHFGSKAQIQPFPMSTQDLQSIDRYASPGPSNLGKRRSPNGYGAKEQKKRREDPSLGSPSWNHHDEEIDSLFPSSTADPKTLCPYCDVPLPSTPTPLLQYLLSPAYTPLYSKSHPDPRPGNPLGRHAPLSAFISVCQRHRFESEMLPEAERKGWPKEIDWKDLARRVKGMKDTIEVLLSDDSAESAGSRSQCVFWQEVVKEYKEKGSRAVTGVRGQFESFEKTQPGYYGEQGSNIIHQTLYSLFPPSSMDPTRLTPLSPNEFISRILVPEIAVNLIMEDQWLSGEEGKAEAVKILRESAAYGVAMFPEDGGEWAQAEKDRLSGNSKGKGRAKATGGRTKGKKTVVDDDDFEMGVADMIVMERARRRRMELEEEMRMEDEVMEIEREAQKMKEEAEEAKKTKRVAKENADDRKEIQVGSSSSDRSAAACSMPSRPRPKPVPITRTSTRTETFITNADPKATPLVRPDASDDFGGRNPKKVNRRKREGVSKAQSPTASDFESSYGSDGFACIAGGPSMDWAREREEEAVVEVDMDLCSDSTDAASDVSSQRRKTRGSQKRDPPKDGDTTPSIRPSKPRSTKAKVVEEMAVEVFTTPKVSGASMHPCRVDDEDTPRPQGRTASTTSLEPSGSSASIFPLLMAKHRIGTVKDLSESPFPSKSKHDNKAKDPWLKSMAATVDVSDDDDMSTSSNDRTYGGPYAYSGSRQGKKKKGGHSWLLSDDSRSDSL